MHVGVTNYHWQWISMVSAHAIIIMSAHTAGYCIEKVGGNISNCPLGQLPSSSSFAFECDPQKMAPLSCFCDTTISMESELCSGLIKLQLMATGLFVKFSCSTVAEL